MRTRDHRGRSDLILLTVLLGAVACSSDSPAAPEDPPAAPEPEPVPAASTGDTVTLHPTGGRLVVNDARGIRLTVDVPEGSVVAPVDFSVVPTSPDSALARFDLTSSDPRLLRPATITVEVPDSIAVPSATEALLSLGGRALPLATTWDEDSRTLTFNTAVLGFTGAGASGGPDRVAGLDVVVGSAQLTLQTLACAVKADLLADALDALGTWLADNQLGSEAIDPIIQVEALFLNLRATCSAIEAEVDELGVLLDERACDAWTRVEDQILLFVPDTTWATTRKHFTQIAQADRLRQTAGVSCGQDAVTITDVAAERFLEVLGWHFAMPLDTLGDWTQTWSRFGKLRGELPAEFTFANVSPQVTQKIEDDVVPGFYGALFGLATRFCNERGDVRPLGDVLEGGGVLGASLASNGSPPDFSGLTSQEIIQVVQTCGSTFRAGVETDAEILDEAVMLTDGVVQSLEADLVVDVAEASMLVFEGPIRSLFCPVPGNEERLVIRRDDLITTGGYPVLASLEPVDSVYLAEPLEIPWSAVVDSLVLSGESGESFRLVIEREEACPGLWGELPRIVALDYTVSASEEPIQWLEHRSRVRASAGAYVYGDSSDDSDEQTAQVDLFAVESLTASAAAAAGGPGDQTGGGATASLTSTFSENGEARVFDVTGSGEASASASGTGEHGAEGLARSEPEVVFEVTDSTAFHFEASTEGDGDLEIEIESAEADVVYSIVIGEGEPSTQAEASGILAPGVFHIRLGSRVGARMGDYDTGAESASTSFDARLELTPVGGAGS